MDNYAIHINEVSKKYKLYAKPFHRVIEWGTAGILKKHDEFWALKDINIIVQKGECLGIIGHNGAGKSTLLKVLSKALWPTNGQIKVKGNMVSLLELGTGFHPELTGLQNIYASARLLGFTTKYINGKLPSILDFSELGDFIHQPVKTYSSGMYVRLAFSLYANLEPDIYVVDEALSVGDVFFQQKCFDFLQKLKDRGAAIILVTHDMQTVKKFCTRVLIMQEGRVVHEGNPLEMVNLFYTLENKARKQTSVDTELFEDFFGEKDIEVPFQSQINVEHAQGIRRGDGKVKILGVSLCNLDGNEIRTADTGDKIILNIYARLEEDIHDLSFGFQFSDRHNTIVFGQNSYMLTRKKMTGRKGEVFKVSYTIEMNLFQGLYTVMVGATDCQTEVGNLIYDWVEGCTTLEILRPSWRVFHGVAFMNSSLSVERSNLKKESADSHE